MHGPIGLGADKAYDLRQFVKDLRERKVTPHITVDGHLSKAGKPRLTAIDGRTRCYAGYAVSQRCRKRIEEVFGWIRASAGMARSSCEVAPAWARPPPFAANGSGEFAFGCVTGQISGMGDGNNLAFSWQGNDEMD